MTGKEALEEIKYCRAYINELGCEVPLSKVREYKIILKELELLSKYKKAFEILKDNCHISNYVVDGVNSGKKITFDVIREWYDKEEYELIEELMKGE